MFRSLLRTIPSVSGNFTLSCRLNDIIKKSDKEYVTYINSAILLPLDNNIKLFRDININLQNAKYEYDIQRYWRLISDSFYKDTYLIHENIFDSYDGNNYNLKDNRDKTFEYGCSRISYNYTGYQFRFYAPIYINDVNDLPDSFNILIKNQNGQILKKIIIPISEKINLNKLRIYLSKFINKLYDNIPAYWNFYDNKIVYKNVVDCKNGGLINFTSYNVIKNNSNQVVINDFDNSISLAYSSNNIIMSEIIPLSFIFNIEDFIKPEDLYYYQFNNFIISGAYVKNGIQQNFYDFDCNYHYKDITYKTFNVLSSSYEISKYNLFSNKQNNAYQEGTELRLYYENTLTHNYFRWKKFETDDYIINANAAYTSEYNRYGEFPILKNSINLIYAHIIKHNIHNNLIIPLKEYTKYFDDKEISNYEYVMNNYYSNWFDIYPSNTYEDAINEDNINMYSWSKVYNGYTYNKGIYYFLQDNNLDYFNIFVNPILSPYNKDIEFSDWVFEYNKNVNNETINIKKSSSDMNYIESNKYLVPLSEDEISEKINEYSNIETRDYDKLNETSYYIKNTIVSEYIKYDDIQNLLSSYNNIDILNLFIKEYGYEKLNKITNSNIVENNKILFYTLLLNDHEKYNNIYYSEYNSKIKKLLKTYLDQNNFDINLFSSEKFSFFYKSVFTRILKPEEIKYSLLDEFSGDNMHSLLYRYKNVYDILIDNIKYCIYTLCNDGNDWHQIENENNEVVKTYTDEEYFIYLGGMPSNDKNSILLNHTNKIIDTIKYIFDNNVQITVDNIFENVFDDIDISNYDKGEIQKTLEYINFLFHYQQIIDNLINNTDSNNIIPKYYYVPYYNDNNIYIDYDFFQKVGYKNQSYDNLYVDSYNLSNYLSNYTDENTINEITDVSNIKNKFISIYNKEILKGYIDELYNDETYVKRNSFNFADNLYHCISFLDNNFNITYKVIKLVDYINLIIHNTLHKYNEYHGEAPTFRNIIDNDNLLYILNNFTIFENNECIINIPFEKYLYTDYTKKFNIEWDEYISKHINELDNNFSIMYPINDHTAKQLYNENGEIIKTSKEYIVEYDAFKSKFEKSYFLDFIKEKMQDIPINMSTIKCNLFYKKQLYKLTPKLYDLCINNIPLYIYKTFNTIISNQLTNRNNIELYNKSNFTENELGYDEINSINDSGEFNLVYLLSRSLFHTSDAILNQQILSKNVHLYNDVYVYEDEKHSFKQVYFEEYMSSYKNHYILYKESDINKVSLQLDKNNNYNKIHVFNYKGKKYGYIVINYNFDCSSNSFNLYNIDNNDNIEIKYINDLEFNSANDNTLVKTIFPYLYPYMKVDIMLSIFSNIKDYIILPDNITLFTDKQVIYYYEADNSNTVNYSKLTKSLNSSKIYINRYFGNICPMLIKVDNILYNQYAKLFKLNNTQLTKLIPNHNNLIKENINIYKYKPITYISNILYKYKDKTQESYYDFIVSDSSQIEYKHFNDNKLFILPNSISFTHDDIPYIEYSKKGEYTNEDICFKYFKNYIKSKYYLKLDENQLLFLFKKYTILKYEENIVKYNIKISKKYCTITYILTLN